MTVSELHVPRRADIATKKTAPGNLLDAALCSEGRIRAIRRGEHLPFLAPATGRTGVRFYWDTRFLSSRGSSAERKAGDRCERTTRRGRSRCGVAVATILLYGHLRWEDWRPRRPVPRCRARPHEPARARSRSSRPAES